VRGDQRADACDARDDQYGVGQGAQRDHRQYVFAPDALAQHERVLGSDGRDEGERRQEADDGGGVHAPTLRSGGRGVQLMIVTTH